LFSTASTTAGVVPGSSGGGTSVFLNGSGGWTTPSGGSSVDYVSYTYAGGAF
jgi:hypothetical protein